MSKRSTKIKRHSAEEIKKMPSGSDWGRVDVLSDEELTARAASDPDNPVLDEAFWRAARRMRLPRKKQVTLRLDADVLDWFQKQGKGYQTRINAVLKAYKESRPR